MHSSDDTFNLLLCNDIDYIAKTEFTNSDELFCMDIGTDYKIEILNGIPNDNIYLDGTDHGYVNGRTNGDIKHILPTLQIQYGFLKAITSNQNIIMENLPTLIKDNETNDLMYLLECGHRISCDDLLISLKKNEKKMKKHNRSLTIVDPEDYDVAELKELDKTPPIKCNHCDSHLVLRRRSSTAPCDIRYTDDDVSIGETHIVESKDNDNITTTGSNLLLPNKIITEFE